MRPRPLRARGCHRGESNLPARGVRRSSSPPPGPPTGVDGDGDGDRDVYDPVDAISGMANYLHASGAPGDWRRALFAYNHAGWYVEKVLRRRPRTARRRRSLSPDTVRAERRLARAAAGLPGRALRRADRPRRRGPRRAPSHTRHRLLRRRAARARRRASARPGDRRRGRRTATGIAGALARRFGWRESCAQTGCPGAGPFRVILYNGYPGHGDPRHSRLPHIHLSWQHGPAAPFTPRRGSRTLFAGPRAGSTHDRARTGRKEVGHDADGLTVLAAVRDVKLDPNPAGCRGATCCRAWSTGSPSGRCWPRSRRLVGAAVWAWASHTKNHHWSASGRRAAGARIAALLIGAAPALINFFAEAGDRVR